MLYKHIRYFFVTASLLFCLSPALKAEQQEYSKRIVVAHRGAWKTKNLPENSIASLKQAGALGIAGSEFDVRMTADDSLVINHDGSFHNLEIEKSKYSQLLAFSLSNGEKLPTLRSYVLAGLTPKNKTKLVCEIKPSEVSRERSLVIAQRVVALIKGLKAQDKVVYISFEYAILKRVLELNPKANTQYLYGDKTPDELKADGIKGLDYNLSVYKSHPEWIQRAKNIHLQLNAWTVNDAADMDWLLANGFDFITTNEPELLLTRANLSPVSKGLKLVWGDEFNQDGSPDSTKWGYNLGNGQDGWGNQEKEYYTNRIENAFVKDGLLNIKAKKENYKGFGYTSARMVTENKFVFTYGTIEVRAKLPIGIGTWPAVWMLGANISKVNWPACGELDIMELKGSEPNKIYGTFHYPGRSGGNADGNTKMIPEVSTSFHKYSMEWTKSMIRIFIDGQLSHSLVNTSKMPFHKDFYIVLNLAIGGGFAGPVDPLFTESAMQIDYVRVFK